MTDNIKAQKKKQMTEKKITKERKTNERESYYISVICFSFFGYYIICHLLFFLRLLYCLSFVFLSVAFIKNK
jgi:hypothetical protein